MKAKDKKILITLLDTDVKTRIQILKMCLMSFRKVTITGLYGASEEVDEKTEILQDWEKGADPEDIIISTSICTG